MFKLNLENFIDGWGPWMSNCLIFTFKIFSVMHTQKLKLFQRVREICERNI